MWARFEFILHRSHEVIDIMAALIEQAHIEYTVARDGVLKQIHSAHVSECLDAIRPLWADYQEKLKAQMSSPDNRFSIR